MRWRTGPRRGRSRRWWPADAWPRIVIECSRRDGDSNTDRNGACAGDYCSGGPAVPCGVSAREGEERYQAAATALGLDAVLAFRLRNVPLARNVIEVRCEGDEQLPVSFVPGGFNAFWGVEVLDVLGLH
jgi:hypothetical protein